MAISTRGGFLQVFCLGKTVDSVMYASLAQSTVMGKFPVTRDTRDIGYRIKLTRIAMGYDSQILAAKVARIAPSAWNNWETKYRRISTDLMFRLKTHLKWPFEWIMDGDITKLPSDLQAKVYEVFERDQKAPPKKPNVPASKRRRRKRPRH
jgi:hypothetical protein